MPKKQFETVVLNFAPGPHTRYEMLDGKEYLVAPVVMLTVGVHSGSNGPILYEEQDLAKYPESWNMKPLVVYHPQNNGQGISACSPSVIETQGVGLIMNTKFDGKLRAEAWFDIKKLEKVDDRILNALEEGKMMEVSTGLFSDNEIQNGQFEPTGEDYVGIARNFRPDHLAILPDKIGACSIADGAGLLQINELSNSDVGQRLAAQLRERYEDAFLMDVFSSWFVFAMDGRLWRMTYSVSENDVVEIGDGPREAVVPQTVYRTVDGQMIGNSSYLQFPKEIEMPKKNGNKKLVDELISNEQNKWTEEHREFLEGQDEAFLQSFQKNEDDDESDQEGSGKEGAQPKKEEGTEVAKGTETQPSANEQQPKSLTFNELLESADPKTRGMIRNGIAAYEAQRSQTIQGILSSPGCTFNQQQLEGMDDDVLYNLSNSLRAVQNHHSQMQGYQSPSYAGAAGTVPQQNAMLDDEPIVPPSSL